MRSQTLFILYWSRPVGSTSLALVLSQYTSITLPFPILFNGGWSSMSLYIEKGLLYAHVSPKKLQNFNNKPARDLVLDLVLISTKDY